MDVKTNVGAKFLKIIDRCFPPGSILHPVLNRKTLKLSYRCLPNIGSIVAGHNCKLLNNFEGRKNVQTPTCNCQKKEDCPVPGKCTLQNVMYHTTVAAGQSVETYVGITANTFKERWTSHKSDFRLLHRRQSTTLSGHIWDCKGRGEDPKLKWKFLKTAAPFSPISKKCNLCIEEKFQILFKSSTCTLNARNELLSSCRHKEAKLLVKPNRKRKRGS